jgi:hypothetical protein
MSLTRSLSLALALALPGIASAAPVLGDASTWVRHAKNDLLPWWTQSGALGNPVGRFPTFRCHDGSAYAAGAPCAELKNAPEWIRSELGRDYVRMQARQVFAYGMGFHLTGDPRLLKLAEAGVRDIRSRALDHETGSPVTYWQDGHGEPAAELRTAQDVAYAGAALAVGYYLTRDAATLADLDRLHQHLMTYFDPAQGRMKWTLAGPEADKAELVAQLDPLNAYMVLVTPWLPPAMKARWQADMRRLTGAIRSQFCAGDKPRCQGTLNNGDSATPGARHNDFGHSGKAFWMSWLAAEQLGDAELATWARDKGRALLRDAYVRESGSWARRWTSLGVQAGNDWWIYAELDQLAGTLAQRERGQAAYLRRTQAFWFKYFVEPGMPEVWSGVSASGDHDPNELRQHMWKNGYHSMEHALVSAITAQALAGKPIRLYFAPSASGSPLGAYFFGGRVSHSRIEKRRGEKVLAVDFALPTPADSPDALASLPPSSGIAFPGQILPLAADNAKRLLGEWEGVWLAEAVGGEGRFTVRFDSFDGGAIRGRLSAFGTGNEEKTTDIAFDAKVSFADGKLIRASGDDSVFPIRYTLRREGEDEYLDWQDRFGNIALQMWVKRVRH